MTVRIWDIESTGTDPMTDKVCEIASIDLVKLTDKYTVTNARETLVNPGVPIPAQASAVHHIIDADVAGKPFLVKAIEPFLQFHDEQIVFVAHNAEFEKSFLKGFTDEIKNHSWVCTYKCALRVWPDLPSHSNQFLRYHFGFVDPFGIPRADIDPHRALSDCYVTGCIFLALTQRAKFADLLAWSAEPALHTVLHFGKHRGKRFDAVDRDYLHWIAEKSDLDEGVKFSARHWLQQKAAA